MLGPVLLALIVVLVLGAAAAVFVYIGNAPGVRVSPGAIAELVGNTAPLTDAQRIAQLEEQLLTLYVQHGQALSELGMAWAEVKGAAGANPTNEYGSGVLALEIRRRVVAAQVEAVAGVS